MPSVVPVCGAARFEYTFSMKTLLLAFAVVLTCESAIAGVPPAVPLVTHDPYTSVWSVTDRLTADWPRHWTGATMGMSGLIRVGNVTYRWCGPDFVGGAEVQPATQTAVSVGWLDTRYTFEAGGVALSVTFGSTFSMGGTLDDATKDGGGAVTIVNYAATSLDGTPHEVSVYLDLSGEWCVHTPDQRVAWTRLKVRGGPESASFEAVGIGTSEQPMLARVGDWTRIDWGRAYVAAPDPGSTVVAQAHDVARKAFVSGGKLPSGDDTGLPRAANDRWPVLASCVPLGTVTGNVVQGRVLIAYDPGRCVEYFERPLRPYWARGRATIGDHLIAAAGMNRDVAASASRDVAINRADEVALAAGGEAYRSMVRLMYRQVMAGHALAADFDGTPLMFSKENTSNGCIATVDVIYPASPFFLYHNPAMLRAQLRPLLDYAQSPRWTFPFAPHDIGTYPKANGQVYGGGETGVENQMPVEESGNMLIMLAALSRVEGTADFAKPYLPVLARWAEYLKEHGVDPTNQLCTDDFAGHMARNVNLSAKTCVAFGAYAELLRDAGLQEEAAVWRKVAEEAASRWMTLAGVDGGRKAAPLTFDGGDTWSQKYNLVWDRVLKLKLFPESLFEAEMNVYKGKLGKYGLPLDSRRTYTKLDWTVWSACLTGRRADFDAVMGPVYAWGQTPAGASRVPVSDWYETTNGKTMGMHTRTVVGGVWMPMLMEKMGVGLKR